MWLAAALTGDGTPDDHLQVILVLTGIVSSLVAALVMMTKTLKAARGAETQAEQVNRAVNMTDGPRIYQLVQDTSLAVDRVETLARTNAKAIAHLASTQEAFEAKDWEALAGTPISSGPKLLSWVNAQTSAVTRLERDHAETNRKLDQIHETLSTHAAWEEAKYEEAKRRPIDPQ